MLEVMSLCAHHMCILSQMHEWTIAVESEASSSKNVKVTKVPRLEEALVTWLHSVKKNNSAKVSDCMPIRKLSFITD